MNRPLDSADAPAPFDMQAVLFDMDGVVTRTARLHATAWAELFDQYLRKRAARTGEPFRPFDPHADYLAYVDGKPRHEGVRSFLAARGIALPEGDPSDRPQLETIHGLGGRKDAMFQRRLRRDGVVAFDSTLELVRALRARGVKTAVVTSSRNGREVLAAAGIDDLFDARLDGMDAEALGLAGKPDPAPFVECAGRLGVAPERAVVIEDSVSGVEAGVRGGFGLVVGVDRGGNREALARSGADVVVADLAELDVGALATRLGAKRDADITWRIEQEGFDPAREHAMESLFSVGNGYLGVRGTLDTPLPASQGDLFVAGIYDRKHPDRPYSEHEFLTLGRGDHPHSELVSAPFPFRVRLTVDGEPLELAGTNWRDHARILHMRDAVLSGSTVYETPGERRTLLRSRRCASCADLHLLLQEITVRLENHSASVDVDLSLADPDLAANHPHLALVQAPDMAAGNGVEISCFTTQVSGFTLCLASRSTLAGSGEERVRWRVAGSIGDALLFRRYAVVYTSRDAADPRASALAHLRALRWEDFEAAFAAHAARWHALWQRADVHVCGSRSTEQALRFHAYHLLSAADRDARVSVGARALTGRAYEGHVFWDVEVFMLPFYLHTCPDVARHLLLYRHRTLDGARRRARELGFAGACYAWESTVSGDDVTPHTIQLRTTGKQIPIFTGTEQVHVSAAVAYGVWRYWEATRDYAFMHDAGVEILAETARFWVSRCTRGPRHFHIRGVVGPDEYHHAVNDNAYTNWMARFNLETAVWALDWLHREFPREWDAFMQRCRIAAGEAEHWAAVARELYCPGPNAAGVIEQFEGFFDLEAYPLPKDERFKAPIDRLFDWDRINRLRIIKQADVLMLPHLFPERFTREALAANYRYYEPLTDHGSSLSPAIHCALAARLGLREDAERYWRQSLWLDLSNVMNNSALGVHPACMGGTWQALVFGFLGIRFGDAGPVLDSDARDRLPAEWRAVSMTLAWRGRVHQVRAQREEAQ